MIQLVTFWPNLDLHQPRLGLSVQHRIKLHHYSFLNSVIKLETNWNSSALFLFCFWLSSPEDSFYHLVYSVPAIISESNLRKTFRFGGRREPPTAAEIQAIVVSMSHAGGGDGG